MSSTKFIGLLRTLTASALLAGLVACKEPTRLQPKMRPAGVPDNAVWAGGADGGAYIQCSAIPGGKVNSCEVWNDYTGSSDGKAMYQLAREGRAATEGELRFSGAANETIYLQGGMVLRRVSKLPSL